VHTSYITSHPQQGLGQNHVIKYVIFQQRNVRIFAISGMNKDYTSITIDLHVISILCGPGSSVGIATDYGLDGPGSNPGGDEIFRTRPYRPWGPPSLLYNGYRVFPGSKERPGRDVDPSPLLVPWSRKSRAIPLLPLWAIRPVQSLSACTKVHFTYLRTY